VSKAGAFDKKQYITQWKRDTVAKGFCSNHSTVKVVEGKSKCQECLDAKKVLYHRHLANGVCPMHPRRKRAPGKTRCFECVERYKAEKVKSRYGLTTSDVESLLAKQDNRCVICKLKLVKKAIDHCHSTGKVRGILCNYCNVGLGQFFDSVERLQGAIAYLTTHKD
jgi:hypothetical protein